MQNERLISTLFTSPVKTLSTVSIVNRNPIAFRQFTNDVAMLCTHIRANHAENWLLLTEDAYAIAVGFMAILHAERTVVFPANLQPGHIDKLTDANDGILLYKYDMPQKENCLEIFNNENIRTTFPLTNLNPATSKIVLHTSGSTGTPLAVEKNLSSLEAELNAFSSVFGRSGSYSILATVPAYHIYGLLFRVLWPLVTNRPFMSEIIQYPEELTRTLGNLQKYILISSPAFLVRAQQVLEIDALKESLVGVFSSGGPLPPKVAEAYNSKLFYPIIEVYGSTETGGVGYRTVYDAGSPAPLTPFPGVTVMIDKNSSALSVQSAFLSQQHPVKTNDLAVQLADGCFKLLGRADRIVKIEEQRISLREVEKILLAQKEIAAVRVEGFEGSTSRKFLIALILPTSDGWKSIHRNGKRELTKKLRNTLTPYMALTAVPRKWRFVRKMPETEHGKFIHSQLQAIFNYGKSEVTKPLILRRRAGHSSLQLKLRLPADLKYFNGHFDSQPILAGVVQLTWAIDYACDEFCLGTNLQRIEALKFYHVLCAGDEAVLQLDYKIGKQTLYFKYSGTKYEYSAGRIHFGVRV